MAILIDFDFVSRDAADAVNAAGTVTFYDTGTTTLKTVYSDAGLTTPLANPYTLDSAGRFSGAVYAPDGERYAILESTSGAATIRTRDPVWGSIEEPADSSYTPSHTGAVSRTQISKNDELVSVLDFMTTAQKSDVQGRTGAVDVSAAIQAAIDHLESSGGGNLFCPEGVYNIGSSLTCNTMVRFIGEGFGSDTSNANGSGQGQTTFKYTGTAAVMLTCVSSTASQYLYNGGIKGILFDGNELATRAIHLRSCVNWDIDVAIRKTTSEGLQLDDSNGVGAHQNYIRVWFVYGSTTTTRPSHGVVIQGSSGNGGAAQNRVWTRGLVYDGDMLRLHGNDNTIVYHGSGVTQSGGSGNSINCLANGGVDSRNHVFHYVVGDVSIDATSHGSRILHAISEGQQVTIASGGQLHYSVVDYVNGEAWATHTFKMSDEFHVPATMFRPDGTVANLVAVAGNLWPAVNFPESAVGYAAVAIPNLFDWSDGNITDITFVFTSDGTSAGNVVFQIRALTPANLAALGTPAVNENATVSVNATATVANQRKHTLATPISFSRDDSLLLRIDRLPSDAGDTHTDNIKFFGAILHYTAEGPDSAGSGTYDVGVISV